MAEVGSPTEETADMKTLALIVLVAWLVAGVAGVIMLAIACWLGIIKIK